MVTAARSRNPITEQARQVSLLRLLLVALALAVLVFAVEDRQVRLAPQTVLWSRWLLVIIGILAGTLTMLVDWTKHRWQLVLHLVFDLAWVGLLVHLTGGVASPAVPLLFAVVLIANLVLPGVLPFVMPALAALTLALTATLYLAQKSPFPPEFLELHPLLADTNRIMGYLAVQVGAFFTVDLLAQLLGRRLREQLMFTDQLLDQLGEGVIAINQHGDVTYVNDEARRLLDFPSDARGRLAAELFAPEALAPVRDLISRLDLPQLRRLKGIHGRTLAVRATHLIGRHGTRLGRTILIADETRLLILEQHAQRSEHLASLGEMAAGIAHEVRNPLTSLRGCAQELADICAKSQQPDAAALAEILVGESDRLGRIVTDFLTLSRLRTPERQPLDLEPLLIELRRMVSLRKDLPPGLTWDIALDDDTPSVLADADQLRQILQNLITNSIDAVRTSIAPHISCRALMAEDDNPLCLPAVKLIITDNGSGIPNELQERVFTPFFSTKAQGTGLGLSLVDRIVREHEGLVQLASKPGQGTEITILLPAISQSRAYRRALGG